MRERVLIAEDNDDMRDLLQEVLEDAGYETLVAANGRQAHARPNCSASTARRFTVDSTNITPKAFPVCSAPQRACGAP